MSVRAKLLMDPRVALDFCDQLRQGRENALRDAEAFGEIIHVVERLGSFLLGRIANLGKYKDEIERVADGSALAFEVPARWRGLHVPFSLLYGIVKDARNDALHQGAFARHLTIHAIELSLVLEDAMRRSSDSQVVGDFMVRNPVCAELWQPLSFVRQQMLSNSYSYLPVKDATGRWCLVSDLEIAVHLGSNHDQRKRRLAETLGSSAIVLQPAKRCTADTALEDGIPVLDPRPVLVFLSDKEDQNPVGILTAFDVL